jgi:putative transcriptional regulator
LKITHHLDEATLLAFAAGTVGEAHGILVASHLAMCPTCRIALRKAESLGGGILESLTEQAVSDICRAATLASLDSVVAPNSSTKPKSDLPLALARAMGDVSLADIRWHKRAPGVSTFDVPLSKGSKTKLKLMKLGHGRAMPEHGHGGEELTLILKGSYHDHMGRFSPGDVADLDHEVEHQPIVDSEEDCICVVAFETQAKFKGFWARLAQPFVGI